MSRRQLHLDQFVGLAAAQRSDLYQIWVPGEQVICHRVQLPAVPRHKWLELLPWMLEESLLASPDQMHFALGKPDVDRWAWALSVPRRQMNFWTSLCGRDQGSVVAMAPDYLALPWEQGGCTLLMQGERWLVRCGQRQGYAGAPDLVRALLARQLAEQPGIQLSVIGPGDQETGLDSDRQRHIAEQLDWAFCEFPGDLNLLSGAYQARRFRVDFKAWGPALAASTLCLLLALGYGLANYLRLQREIPALQAELSATYRALLGAGLPQQGLQREAREKIAFREAQYVASQSSVLRLLSGLDPALSSCNGCRISVLRIQGDSLRIEMQADQSTASRLRSLADLEVELQQSADNQFILVARLPGGGGG